MPPGTVMMNEMTPLETPIRIRSTISAASRLQKPASSPWPAAASG
jgi:hypothetical protein